MNTIDRIAMTVAKVTLIVVTGLVGALICICLMWTIVQVAEAIK